MNLIYYNEIQNVINIKNALINEYNNLLQQNNGTSYNQSIGTSQNEVINSIPNTFLQRQRKADDLNNEFSENNPQSPCLIEKGVQCSEEDDENVEYQLNNELERIKMNNDINAYSNNNIINNSTLFEKKNKFEKDNNLIFKINKANINRTKINEILINQQSKQINSNLNSLEPNIINENKNRITRKFDDLDEKSNGGDENNKVNEKETYSLNNVENNNEVKVLKNNKVVYVNNYLLKSPSTSKKLKKLNQVAFIGRSKRSSRFRGVSKNGNQWQVLLMYKKGKSYVGNYSSEELAAKIYDILALKYRGIKARTNFKYTYEQIRKIGEIDFDIKSKNLAVIVNELEIISK